MAENVTPDECSVVLIRRTALRVSVQPHRTRVHTWADKHTRTHTHTHTHRCRPINKSLVLRGQVESSPEDTSPVPRDQSVARGNPCVCSLSVSQLKRCTQIRLHSSGTSAKLFFTERLKSDPVSASGAACFTLSNRRQWGKEGVLRLQGGGVIPTKTLLQSVLIERKNVLADRPFQPGHLEVLDQPGRPR